MHPIIRTPGPFLQPRQVIPTQTHTTTEHYFNSDSGGAGRRSIGRPVEEARNLVEKFPAVSSDTVLIRTTYPICRSSFRLSSGPRNAGCFALFRFSFPWVFHENFYVYLAIGYCIYVLYSISYFLCMNYIHRSLVRCLKSLYLCSVSVWVP